MSINHQYLLPEPSILEKLQARDAQAPEQIMQAAETIGAARREAEAKLVSHFSRVSHFSWASLLGALSPKTAINAAYDQPQDAASVIRNDWAHTGDSLRRAITAHMNNHGLTADMLQLNAEERASLVLAYPDPSPKPAETRPFRKIFPKL